jgi:plasmid maintenance system killer protein
VDSFESFGDDLAKAIFQGASLGKKLRKQAGDLDFKKAAKRLKVMDAADEKALLLTPGLNYHALIGTGRYRIDADARNSKWRITFAWAGEELVNVKLVRIENTHS